jgi:hypothetical protein
LFYSRRNAEKKKSSEKSVVLGDEEWALAGLLHTGAAGSGVFFFPLFCTFQEHDLRRVVDPERDRGNDYNAVQRNI